MPIRFQVDPDFYDHPKTINMSDAATALWVRAGSYSAAKLTDGFIAEHVLALLSKTPDEAADELTRRRLWHKVRGGYRFHEWSPRNLTKERVEADQKADRERKRRERGSAPSGGKPQLGNHVVRPDSKRSPPGQNPDSVGIPAVSVSVSESVSVSGRGSPSADSLGSEPDRQCPTHHDDPDPPPCRRCATARERWEAWQAEKRRLATEAPDCPRHPGSPAHNCGLCRSELIGAA